MAAPKILVTRRMPPNVQARIERDYDATGNEPDVVYPADTLVALAKGHSGILCAPSDRLTPEVIADLPEGVRILSTFSVGYEHINVPAAAERGIVVTNTPDVLTDATADIALLCMLGAARRAFEGDQLVRNGGWVGWNTTMMLGVHLGGKRLGIFGMGRIGRAVAKRARGFGMEIHYYNRGRLDTELEQGATYYEDPEALLANSDFLSINAPSSPETRKFLNAERIDRMPDGAIVVNTARGELVDDDALIAALKSGKLAAAGLDVFDGEPNLDKRYVDLPNTFLLPHLGSATHETRDAMGFKCLDNLDAYFAGRECPSALNR